MSARFRCKYCGGPVNAKADGIPLPCPNLACPCTIGVDPYVHVFRVPEQGDEPLIPGGKPAQAPVFGKYKPTQTLTTSDIRHAITLAITALADADTFDDYAASSGIGDSGLSALRDKLVLALSIEDQTDLCKVMTDNPMKKKTNYFKHDYTETETTPEGS